MSSISEHKVILVIDTDSALADSLSAHLHNHEIIHVKNEMEADLKYREIVSEDRQINLIVLYDVTGNALNWEAVMETLFDVSIQPNIIVLDADPDIQKAVSAYSNMAYHYHDKTQTTHEDVAAWIEEIKVNPVTQIKLDKSFYKDNVWSRHVKDRHELLVEVKLGNKFDEKMNKVRFDSVAKPKDEKTLLELAVEPYLAGDLDFAKCIECIEIAIARPIAALPKSTVLVIEDEQHMRENLCAILAPQFNVISAGDAATALDKVKNHPEISLALMDVYLPDENGTELYPKIRKENDLINLIVLTAFKEMHVAELLIKKGAYGYINKPYNPIDLYTKLGRAWNKKVWPYFEGKIELQELNFIQRLFFLDVLIKERRDNSIKRRDPGFEPSGTKYQQNSQLCEVYASDIYALFPELFQDDDLSDDIF